MSIEIKILKSSCCTTGGSIAKILKEAAIKADIDIHLETLTDLKDIMKYGVINFPSVVIDGHIYSYDEINDRQVLERIFKELSN